MRPPNLRVANLQRRCGSCTSFVPFNGDRSGSGRCAAYPGSFVNERFICDEYEDAYEDEEPTTSRSSPIIRGPVRKPPTQRLPESLVTFLGAS